MFHEHPWASAAFLLLPLVVTVANAVHFAPQQPEAWMKTATISIDERQVALGMVCPDPPGLSASAISE